LFAYVASLIGIVLAPTDSIDSIDSKG